MYVREAENERGRREWNRTGQDRAGQGRAGQDNRTNNEGLNYSPS